MEFKTVNVAKNKRRCCYPPTKVDLWLSWVNPEEYVIQVNPELLKLGLEGERKYMSIVPTHLPEVRFGPNGLFKHIGVFRLTAQARLFRVPHTKTQMVGSFQNDALGHTEGLGIAAV